MSTRQFLESWYRGVTVAGAIVAVVAALLLVILATARSIESSVRRIQKVADGIVANTVPIWKLGDTNRVAGQLLEDARVMERDVALLADSLEAGLETED